MHLNKIEIIRIKVELLFKKIVLTQIHVKIQLHITAYYNMHITVKY